MLPNDIFAAEEIVNDFGDIIKQKERKEALRLLKERDMEGFKNYCHTLAENYEIIELSSSYYFHLN